MHDACSVFLSIVDLLNARDFDGVYRLLQPGHRQFVNGVCVAETSTASRAADEPLYALLPDFERVVHDVFGTATQVASRSTWRGTTPTGVDVSLEIASMMTVLDGLVAESHLFVDLSPLAALA